MESRIVVICLLLPLFGVGGRCFSISREEDLELEKDLARLNKPAVKTVLTEHGELYDCVDFYKQPAFDHPCLKDHTFHLQMKPNVYPKRITHKLHSNAKLATNGSSDGIGCPIGTVPIKRITKEDLIRAKIHEQMYGYNGTPLTAGQPGVHYAIVRTKTDKGMKYNGGRITLSIEMPRTKEAQYSMGRIRFANGPDSIEVGWMFPINMTKLRPNGPDSIEVGWMVNPTLYGDNRTRLFISLKTINSSCFNVLCPGFILVREDMPVDSLISPISQLGGPTYVYRFFVYRDKLTGNWYLGRGDDHTIVGWWPKKVFSNIGLQGSAIYVDWGGEVYSPPNMPSPDMGRGYMPIGDIRYDAYCLDITTVNEDNVEEDAQNTEAYLDNKRCYRAKDQGIVRDPFRHWITYGGWGGCTGY